MGSSGGSKETRYSDVDTHYTEVNPEDYKAMIPHGWETGYFQTGNAFDINNALRASAEYGYSLQEAVELNWATEETQQAALKTIEAMDRSMSPLNKDTKLVRMADELYLEKLMSNAGLPEDVQGRLYDATRGFTKFRQEDVDALRSAILADTVHENAFMSTTYNTSLSDSMFTDRRVRIEIDAVAGTPALYSPTGLESECVLGRDVGYGINDVQMSEDGRRLIISVETGY